MKLEYARLATSTPPLSSPYFLTTPNTKAVGVKRCWIASILRMTRSTGFTATTRLRRGQELPPAIPAKPG